jgi:hypothetical protein
MLSVRDLVRAAADDQAHEIRRALERVLSRRTPTAS